MSKRATKGDHFLASPTDEEVRRQRQAEYTWVAKHELVGAIVLITLGLCHWYGTDGWLARLAGVGAVVVAYAFISTVMNRVADYSRERDRELNALRQQLVAFTCALHDRSGERVDVSRLADAVTPQWRREEQNLSEDDWAIISRSWEFWRDGFEEQDRTPCANCGSPRTAHAPNGKCPTRAPFTA